MKDLAPIVIFVYNRPKHTRKTLEALSKNMLANQSTLYIYSDGAKKNASMSELEKINQVRFEIRQKLWTRNVFINERKENFGLSKSIISGITEVLDSNTKIIVLEDDTIPEEGFLKFMNYNLNKFNFESFAGISGFSYEEGIKTKGDMIITKTGSIWGWGTWRRVWEVMNFDANYLIERIVEKNMVDDFNSRTNYFSILKMQLIGKVDSWAILFYANYFLEEKYFILPNSSLIRNIGMDGTGIHYNKKYTFLDKLLSYIKIPFR